MSALAVLYAAALVVAVRVGLREAGRDEADARGVMPRVHLLVGGRRAPRAAALVHAGFVALGVASLLVMLLSLAASLAG